VYYLYYLAGLIAPLIPLRLGYWLADRIGDLVYRLNRAAREAVFDNLRHVLGPTADEDRIVAVARRVFRNQLRNYFDLFRVPALSRRQIERLVDAPVIQVADEGLAAGRGLVVVSFHFGNLDVVMQWLSLRGYQVVLVIEHLKPEKLHRYVRKLRGSRGLRLLETDGAIKAIYRALQANEMVLLAADRDVTGSGRLVEFFGAPARLPDGYARLVRRTGARLAFAFGRRCPDNTFKVEAWLAPEFPTTGNRQADEQAIINAVLPRIEQQIRAYPEQWIMFRRIWNGQG
jgi:KDO2-lipid IV(A) lauroyltransferase